MSKTRKALEAALEVLEQLQGGCTDSDDGTVEVLTVWCPEIIEQIQAALAEPEQEPVYQLQNADGAWIDQAKHSHDYNVKHGNAKVRILYTSPKPREWQELSEDEVRETMLKGMKLWLANDGTKPVREFQYAEISAALRAKNGG